MRKAVAGLLSLMIVAALLPAGWHALHRGRSPASPKAPAQSERANIHIQLNGSPLAQGKLIHAPLAEPAVYVRVRDIAEAVDGPTATGSSLLRASGSRLDAVATGGCAGCPLRVVRPVRISGAMRRLDGEAYVPLADLVRALEGRLEADARHGSYGIFVGACTWCVLEPGARTR